MADRVTAVIVAYWPLRFKNLPVIIKDLQNNTRPPDNIIVFNNNDTVNIGPFDGAVTINSGANFTSRSKYPVALLDPSNYYLLIDDDNTLGPRAIESWMKYAEPECCFSTFGTIFTSNILSNNTHVDAFRISEPVQVDAFIGTAQFVSFEAIVKMLEFEPRIRWEDRWGPHRLRFVAEDILLPMVNDSMIVPLGLGCEKPLTTDYSGPAMQHDEGYFYIRDWFAWRVLKLLGKDFKGRTPEHDGVRMSKIDHYWKILDERDQLHRFENW